MRAQQKISVTLDPPDVSTTPSNAPGRYLVRMAENASELASAFKLRHDVFDVELGGKSASQKSPALEFDAYDFKCRHLIVICRDTNTTVGTYRLNSIETAGSTPGFYSATEFNLGDLPDSVLEYGIEIGRACIAKEHRNTKVLFLLWKSLLDYLHTTQKRYFFGCCSLFTRDAETGRQAYEQLRRGGYLDNKISLKPIRNGLGLPKRFDDRKNIELPNLFKMYLRLGAKVCSPPMIDSEFGTIDFFVVFDVKNLNDKYRRMFR